MAKTVVGHLVYLITGDSQLLDKSLKKSQDTTAKFTRFMRSALGLGGTLITVKAVLSTVKDLVAAYSEQEQAESKLAAAIRATGGDVETLMERYNAFASEVQRTTTVGDEQTLGLLQQARSLGITTDRMEEAVRGAIGLSKAFGIDMSTALRGVALGFQGQFTILSRYIPELRTAGTEAEQAAALQRAMADGFEVAKAEGETTTGAIIQLQNAVGDLRESGGKMILDFLEPAIRGLRDLATNTATAVSETQRLNEVEKRLAEGQKVAAEDELALAQRRLQFLEGQRIAALESTQFTGQGVEALEREIALEEARIRQLTEAARWEALGAEARRKGDEEAAARAAAEAQRQKELADWVKMVNDEYGKTEKAQREILLAQIAKWEYELSRSRVYKPQIEAILQTLYAQRDAVKSIVYTRNQSLDQLRAEQAAEIAKVEAIATAEEALEAARRQRRDEEAQAERDVAAQRDSLRQQSFDFAVQMFSLGTEFYRAQLQTELDELDRKLQRDLELAGDNEEEKAKLREEFEKERAKLEYEAALKSWKLQLVGAIAAGARAIAEAAKNAWPIPALPMMALASLMTGLQVATIRKQKPVPEFAEGADFIVPPGFADDSFPMRVESGEHVQVTPAGEVGGEMFRVIVNLDRRPIIDAVAKASRSRELLIDAGSVVRG